eukprot:12077157-Heterocapsa_arctica.AAC.1
MNDIALALNTKAGISAWFRDAVEISRFYVGGDDVDMLLCAKRTAARIMKFIEYQQTGAPQFLNRRWQL